MTIGRGTYRNLEINQLLRESRHFIAETEAILAYALRRKHIVALSFFGSFQNHFVKGSGDLVIDIEGATGLHLLRLSRSSGAIHSQLIQTLIGNPYQQATYSKVKSHLDVLLCHIGVKARLLMSIEFVRQRGR